MRNSKQDADVDVNIVTFTPGEDPKSPSNDAVGETKTETPDEYPSIPLVSLHDPKDPSLTEVVRVRPRDVELRCVSGFPAFRISPSDNLAAACYSATHAPRTCSHPRATSASSASRARSTTPSTSAVHASPATPPSPRLSATWSRIRRTRAGTASASCAPSSSARTSRHP